jgi:hypothetical protein
MVRAVEVFDKSQFFYAITIAILRFVDDQLLMKKQNLDRKVGTGLPDSLYTTYQNWKIHTKGPQNIRNDKNYTKWS